MSRLVVCVVLALSLAACGGGGGSSFALGEQAVVEHTTTTLAVTVLAVRTGTQAELERGGFSLDPEEQSATPYYVDTRYENQGAAQIDRQLFVSLEDQDGNLISSTTIIDLGGPPFEQCPKADGELTPGQSYESCALFLVPEGTQPSKVSFLPQDPEGATDFITWKVPS